jgi:hypothetical protein
MSIAAAEPMSLDDGLCRFPAAFQRLQTEPQKILGRSSEN